MTSVLSVPLVLDEQTAFFARVSKFSSSKYMVELDLQIPSAFGTRISPLDFFFFLFQEFYMVSSSDGEGGFV